jgi:Na+/H+ antiporter NhaD/arsenite permease-like protein
MELSVQAYGAIAVFLVAYAFIATEKVDRAIASGLGAAAVILLGFVPYDRALAYIDLNVLFLLMGMMMIVGLLGTTGLFEWAAMKVARGVRGNGPLVLAIFVVGTAVISALLDNVTTIILVAPVTLLVCKDLGLPAVPFLILEAVFSNIGGTATLIGDPPNVLIGSKGGLSFNEFIIHLGPIVAVIMVVSLLAMHLVYRRQFAIAPEFRDRVSHAHPQIADRRNAFRCLAVLGVVLAGFFLGHVVHLGVGVVALAGGLLMTLVCRARLTQVLARVDWTTILFFIGLFMLVGALQEQGVFLWLGRQIMSLTGGNLLLTVVAILWVSAIASAIVDNIPLVFAMIPLILSIIPTFAAQAGLAADSEATRETITLPLFWALALGACLGGNGSLIGASANVVVSQIARKHGHHLTFWHFTRLGAPLMLLSLVLSTVYLYLRYFVWP